MQIRSTLMALTCGVVALGAAQAQTAAPTLPTVSNGAVTNTPAATPAKPLVDAVAPTLVADGQFRGTLGLGASLSGGNSRASNLALTGSAVRATPQDKISLYALALRTSAQGETTGEQLRTGGRYDHNLSAVMFGFGGLDLERNKFANLKLRSQLSAGLGYHYLNTPSTTLDLFGGLAYTADKYIAAADVGGAVRNTYTYPSLMLGEESTHVLSPTTTFKQRFVLYPNLRDTGEFRATLDAGLAVAMTRAVSLNVGLGAAYNSMPGAGRKTTDTLLTTGMSVKFD